MKTIRPPAGEDLYEVIDGRYQRAATVLTSNRALFAAGWKVRYLCWRFCSWMHMLLASPFTASGSDLPTLRQRAIAALIQQIWDQTSQAVQRRADQPGHSNWGVPQSKLPPVDRWANAFTAFVLDRWINTYAARFGGLERLGLGSQGEQRAAQVLFMLWSIARFGADRAETQVRRQPASLHDIPASEVALMEEWWQRSLDSSNGEIDRQFGEAFLPTFTQALVDRCIARAAIGCQRLAEEDLVKIAGEQEIGKWADRLAELPAFCVILRRQVEARGCPTILIIGPTCTCKSAVAWELARSMDSVVIAADPFQICAFPPIALGVGLPAHLPPPGIRTFLYRSRIPEHHRPNPNAIADWIAAALDNEECRERPQIIEGGSISVAVALLKREIPTHIIVFQAESPQAKALLRRRMAADEMSSENLLAEARVVRESGLEFTWVVRESVIYPKLFETLGGRLSPLEMMCRIESDWQRLIADQQQWFAELRALNGVLSLPPTRQSADIVRQVIDC